MQLHGICPRPSSTTPSFHHHHLHGEGPPLRRTWLAPRSTTRRRGWKIRQNPPKSGQNFSWHLYYMLKMQFPLKLNRIPGGPIPFSLLEILPFLPQGLPRLPSPGSTLIELKKKTQKVFKTSVRSLSILFSKDASVCLSLSTFCSTWAKMKCELWPHKLTQRWYVEL